jgi:hypothetical protein
MTATSNNEKPAGTNSTFGSPPMPNLTVSLLDADASISWSAGEWSPRTVPQLSGDWSVTATTLVGGVSEGVQCLKVANGKTTWWIIPTRGMGIWKAQRGELPIGWKSPVGRPVHPAFVNLAERGGLGWLNGFNELLCRCGLAYQGPPGEDNGEKLTLHGRIANLPATKVELRFDPTGAIEIRGVVEEKTFFGPCYHLETTYRTKVGDDRIEVTDVITNLGARSAPLMLLYHVNVGTPLLEAGAKVTVPSQDIVPRDAKSGSLGLNWNIYDPPTAGFAEDGFFFNPLANADGWCTALLESKTTHRGFAVRFRTETLPWFTVWKNTMALEEGYVTGIEPGVNLPNLRPYERDHGRLPMIAPGKSYRCELELIIADGVEEIRRLQLEAASCQGSVKQQFHTTPQPGWSPQGDGS